MTEHHERRIATDQGHPPNGQRVRLVYLVPGVHRVAREIVADFLAYDDFTQEFVLSGRPAFGTTQIKREHVHEMWTTTRAIHPPERYHGETRLL